MNHYFTKVLASLIPASLSLVSCGKRDLPAYVPPPGISWSSVLARTADIATIADPVQTYERSLHFSSSAATGKVLLANLAPEIMGDMDHGFFLNVIENPTGVDATLAEVRGKGMITWIWSANPAGILRLFVDDETTPAIEMPFKDFLSGAFLPIGYPFSALTANGYNLHFPLLHDRYCKVVVRMAEKKKLAPLYYQIAWNAVAPTQQVARFSRNDISGGADMLRQLGDKLLNPFKARTDSSVPSTDLEPGQTTEFYSSTKAGTITDILFHARTKDELAHLQLMAYWDGATSPNVACPLYLLAGTSERMEDVRSFPAEVKGSCALIQWPMPFRTARLALKNNSKKLIRLAYSITTTPQSGSMRFGAQLQNHAGLWTDRHNIITLADIAGPGRIVGCNIQVKSRTDKWWGEGDQLIYLNSTETPSWRGTGTEDYFGLAWCSKSTFDHPLRGQSSVREDGAKRTSAMHRYHFHDQLPFHGIASFQTEAWGLSGGFMDYESLVMYYTNEEAQQTTSLARDADGGIRAGEP